jgi:hypothetical protein
LTFAFQTRGYVVSECQIHSTNDPQDYRGPLIPSRIMKKAAIIVMLWLLGLAITFVGLQIHEPYLFSLGRFGAGAMLAQALLCLRF